MRRFCRIKAYLRRWGYVCGTLRLFRVSTPYNAMFFGLGAAYGVEWIVNETITIPRAVVALFGVWSLISLLWDGVEKEHRRERLAQLD